MRKLSLLNAGSAGAALILLILAGCSDAQKQRWNEFWGVDSGPKRTVRPSSGSAQVRSDSAAPDKSDSATAQSGPSTAGEDPLPKADNAERNDVDEDVSAYAANMNRTRAANYQPNDLSTKLQRQQDPDRQKRIHEAASNDKADDSQSAQPADGDAMDRYERNTGVSVQSEEPVSRPGHRAPPDSSKGPESTGSSVIHKTGARGPKTADGSQKVIDSKSSAEQSAPTASNGSRTTANGEAGASGDSHHSTGTGANSGLPELEDISVTSAPPASAAPAEISETAEPSVRANQPINATDSDDSFNNRIAAQERLVAADPNNLEQQYRLRMMYLIDGQDEKARAEIPGVDADIQQIITAQIDSLISARSVSGRDPATWATRQLDSIEELRRLVRERADLVVSKIVLCSEVASFGRYTPIEPAEFKVGRRNRTVIYIEIDNFSCRPTNSGMYRTLLSARQALLTRDGKEVWVQTTDNIEELARRPRRDFYLCTKVITIPSELPPGEYVVKVEVEDILAGKMNSATTTFKIVP
ncbi:MAG: hypothetical protein KF841_09490 [Phycisphaerae bacterium]|nr:hypothetical protein [Phycisphaerae bacterium]